MRRGLLLAIGFGFYAAGLIVLAPATLIDGALMRASDGRLRVAQAQGTIWSGAGILEIRDVSGRNAIAKNVVWHVSPESLWRGRMVCEVELERAPRPFRIAFSFSKVEISNAEIDLPAAALAFAEPKLKPLRLTGDLVLRATNLSLGQTGTLGNITLQWNSAGSAFSPVSPFGSYEFHLDGQGKTARATLNTLQGPLQIDGSGLWATGRSPEFNAILRVPIQYRDQLTPLLRLISTQTDEGSFELHVK